MPNLIVVSGSINAGKSTVSGLLVERLQQGRRRAAHVQGDALRHFVTQLPLEEAVPVTLQNIIAVSKTFLVAGFDVVVDYPLYRPSYEGLCEALAGSATALHALILSPPLEVAQRRRGERVLSLREVERIAHHYRTGLHDPGFGVRIDNARQTPQETVELILRQLS
jgi:adenylylsulfate kinase-like enzyme